MNIQELLNNGTIEREVIIKLAANSDHLDKIQDDLQNTRLNLIELKGLVESTLKDTHNYKDMIAEYSRFKSDIPDYTMKDYINWKFSINFDNMNSLVSTNDSLTEDLYYDENNNSLLEFISGAIGYDDPNSCLSATGMITYFRLSFEDIIIQINSVIIYTLKLENLLFKLQNLLIDQPNLVIIFKMSMM